MVRGDGRTRCTARRAFIVTAVCFSEISCIPRAKARAVCRLRTVRFPRSQSGLQTGRLRSPLKVPCKSVAPLMNCAFLRRAQEASAHNTDAEMMEDERGDAFFVLAGLVWYRRQAREQLGMHAHINTSCTIRHGRHARLMCSQAAARQWSSHTMDIYGSTSRGPLHVMVVHAVMQWLASLCRMCRPRAIARSTSHSACAARVVRGRY